MFLAHRENETVLHVGLDYVLPEYKDFKNGKYVYFKLKQKFIDAGYTSVVAKGNNQNYQCYFPKCFHNVFFKVKQFIFQSSQQIYTNKLSKKITINGNCPIFLYYFCFHYKKDDRK